MGKGDVCVSLGRGKPIDLPVEWGQVGMGSGKIRDGIGGTDVEGVTRRIGLEI